MAMVQATLKPPHYFLKHTVIVVTQLPLRCVPRALEKWLILAGLVVQSTKSSPEKEANSHSKSLSARQNQGLAWSSDSHLLEN